MLCFEAMRKIVLQLKMAEWGIYGIGDGTAGTFLAQHFATLGPYFGDLDPFNWPHSPFVNEPTQLELKFNEKMIQMTEIMSNGSLQDVSLLDLSAFGSTIAWLNRNHSRESSWPIEMNFEVLKRCKGNCQIMVEEYKTLLDDWKNYMTMVIQNNPSPTFTPLMKKNGFFDFTKHIKKDLKTFLIAIHGSQLSPAKKPSSIWRDTAHAMFKNKKDNRFVNENGLYDKLIVDCTFQRNLLRMTSFENKNGGCDESFHPTLTTRGFCQTFNGKTGSETWRESNITNEFQELFPMEHSDKIFDGAGDTEGDKLFLNFKSLSFFFIKTFS